MFHNMDLASYPVSDQNLNHVMFTPHPKKGI